MPRRGIARGAESPVAATLGALTPAGPRPQHVGQVVGHFRACVVLARRSALTGASRSGNSRTSKFFGCNVAVGGSDGSFFFAMDRRGVDRCCTERHADGGGAKQFHLSAVP